jgi:cytidine deaminase
MSAVPIVARSSLSPLSFALGGSGAATYPAAIAHPWILENRLNLTGEELTRAVVLLDYARHQQHHSASPLRSQFRVGASALCGNGTIAFGANAEYGGGARRAYDEGVHAEEAAIAHALQLCGRDVIIEMIAVASDSQTPSSACGKCRSIIETYGRPDTIIVSVGSSLQVTMWKLSELLPNMFDSSAHPGLIDAADPQVQQLFAAAELTRRRSFDPFSRQVLGRSVAAIAANGAVFSLPRIDSLAFYGTSSLRASLSAVWFAQPTKLDGVLISCASGMPTGEDRQLLFEFASFLGQADTLPVYLHKEGTTAPIVTTPSALLPYGFGPKDLGIDAGSQDDGSS